MNKNNILQLERIIGFFIRKIKKSEDKEKIKISCIINKKLAMTKQFAMPSDWGNGYKEALNDIKNEMGFTGTVYELYRD